MTDKRSSELKNALHSSSDFLEFLKEEVHREPSPPRKRANDSHENIHPSVDTICDYVQGTLNEPDTEEVMDHLAACSTCASAVLRARRVADELNQEIMDWANTESWGQRISSVLKNTLCGEAPVPVAASSHKDVVCFEKGIEAMQDKDSWDTLDLPAITVKVEPQAQTLKPWPHQTSAWNSLDGHYLGNEDSDGGQAGIMVVPTGGGKTWLACNWLLRNHVSKGGRVLWLTHRHSLLRQSFKVFARNASLASGLTDLRLVRVSSLDLPFSAVGADDNLVFATIQSAARNESYVTHMAEQSPKGLFVVFDEAHHAAAPTYRKLLEVLVNDHQASLLGLTATPILTEEDNQAILQKIFASKMLYQVSMKDLIHSGILAHPVPVTVKTEIEFERDFNEEDIKHLERFGELSQRVLEILAKHAHRNRLIVKHYKDEIPKYAKTIVFAANILHARTLAKEFNDNGVQADYVDSCRSSAENRRVIESFSDPNGIPVIVNVEMLTEGFDAPITQTVFIARPTASEILLRQMVGRALRGPEAGGGKISYLVTFVDTWNGPFSPLSGDYVFEDIPTNEPPEKEKPDRPTIPIPEELIWLIYEYLKGKIIRERLTHFDCLPHSWFSWLEELEDDVIRRHVLVFENQADAYDALYDQILTKTESIPEEISDGFAEKILRDYFSDTPDPQPSVHDIKILLSAYKRGNEVTRYTLLEKQKVDPTRVASELWANDIGPRQWKEKCMDVFNENPLCRALYRGESGPDDFYQDVATEVHRLIERQDIDQRRPTAVPDAPQVLRTWEPGYQLNDVWDAVTSQKGHFPHGIPRVSDYRYSKKHLKSYWGICRYKDATIVINRTLNSPDVPRFVMEFLMYHEVLHADMPYSAHNKEFRNREKRFIPSEAALKDAEERGIKPGSSPDTWRVWADQYLDSFHRRFKLPDPPETISW